MTRTCHKTPSVPSFNLGTRSRDQEQAGRWCQIDSCETSGGQADGDAPMLAADSRIASFGSGQVCRYSVWFSLLSIVIIEAGWWWADKVLIHRLRLRRLMRVHDHTHVCRVLQQERSRDAALMQHAVRSGPRRNHRIGMQAPAAAGLVLHGQPLRLHHSERQTAPRL